MTAPEPRAMTLAEALVYLARNREGQGIDDPDYDVGIQALPDGRWRGYTQRDVGTFDTWPEAFTAVLGVPVVERDPTAELVEAVEAWAKAYSRAYDEPLGPSEVDEAVWEFDQAEEALLAALARVKGGER